MTPKNFVVKGLLAVAALASASPGMGATGVKFMTSSLDVKEVEISAQLFKPAGEGPFPAVVLLHTCAGLEPHVTRDWPNYLSGLGYVVVTFDSYNPRGFARCNQSKMRWQLAQASDAYGALDYLQTLPFVDGDRVAVMGFSSGGVAINDGIVGASMGRGRDNDFRAAISLYASCRNHYMYRYTEEDIPLMQIVGENDYRLAKRCVDVGKRTPMEVHVLKWAYHAFDQSNITRVEDDSFGNPMKYSHAATERARELTKAFLDKHLR